METSFIDIFKDDTTKMWSLSRLSAASVLVFNLIYAAYSVFKTGAMADIGNNWMLTALALYGLNKGVTTLTNIKAGANEVSVKQGA